tara:strand:+ start:1199 stop:1381 length:183 start_codon:yes stop_codon:yes gene_type:complete
MSDLHEYRVEISETTLKTYFVVAKTEDEATMKVVSGNRDVYYRGEDIIGSGLHIEEQVEA